MNILYIGSSGALSLVPFKQLLSSEHSIAAVGVFNPIVINNKIIALENSSLSLLAAQQNISILDLSQTVGLIVGQIKQLSIDVILMSCYGKHLPDEVAALAKLGCFNMHPSLLPKYRGPEPIFWQMKYGDAIGVSWHHVTKEFDAGAVVKQKAVFLEDGASYQKINVALAETGADLMMDMLAELAVTRLVGCQQKEELSSYYGYPVKEDFIVDLQGTAQDAYNFMKATEAFSSSYLCQIDNHCYILDKALDYDNNDHLQVAEVSGNTLNTPCNEGVLIVTFTAKL